MSDTITTGNKRDKWTLRATELLNWLIENKSAVLVAGDNITLTPQQDGTIEISAEGGGADGVADVQVDGTSVVDANDIAQLATFTGATSSANGTKGLVKQPLIADKDKFLKGDGTWAEAGGGNVDDVVMNGQSIVDANKIANFNNYVELTRAEWEALPDSKYSDGILYCIKDSGSEKSNFFSPIIYSLAEREVGVWTDGRPLYSQTFSFTTPTQAQANTEVIVLTIAGSKLVRYMDFMFACNSSNHWYKAGQLDRDGWSYVTARCVNGEIRVKMKTGSGTVNYTAYCSQQAYVTLYYTKTTDNPGTGKWTTSGVPAHHYSTEEQVIGTWVDGKPLYEKTIDCGALPDSTSKLVEHNISNIDCIANVFGTSQNTTTKDTLPLSYAHRSQISSQVQMDVTSTYVVIYTAKDNTSYNKTYITIQYTKTTD